MPTLTKRFKSMVEKVPGLTPLPLAEAVAIVKQFDTRKFNQSVEVAIRLGIDPKQADQAIRGSVVLPNGIGK
jgi:large subunit ribosomal protein L1